MGSTSLATEMALNVLSYNLTRVLNIVGVKPLLAAMRDNGMVGRIDVKADDLVQFSGKLRIVGQLELGIHPAQAALSNLAGCS